MDAQLHLEHRRQIHVLVVLLCVLHLASGGAAAVQAEREAEQKRRESQKQPVQSVDSLMAALLAQAAVEVAPAADASASYITLICCNTTTVTSIPPIP